MLELLVTVKPNERLHSSNVIAFAERMRTERIF